MSLDSASWELQQYSRRMSGPMKNPKVETRSRDSNLGPHDCKADAVPHDHGHHVKRLLTTMWKKGEMLVTSIFSFSHYFFATLNFSFANAFKLDKSMNITSWQWKYRKSSQCWMKVFVQEYFNEIMCAFNIIFSILWKLQYGRISISLFTPDTFKKSNFKCLKIQAYSNAR